MTHKRIVFIESKGVDLSSGIWPSRSLKGSLQKVKLILDLLCHERNSFITTLVVGSSFEKSLRLYLREKF